MEGVGGRRETGQCSPPRNSVSLIIPNNSRKKTGGSKPGFFLLIIQFQSRSCFLLPFPPSNMGNGASSSSGSDRRPSADVLVAATPYPDPQQYFPYAGYYHAPAHQGMLLPFPVNPHHRGQGAEGAPSGPLAPVVEYTATIRNDINLRRETLRIEPDKENPGHYLVAFTFDAVVAGRITVIFFAKEGVDSDLTPMKENLKPTTMSFKEGLVQTFKQPSGLGINFSWFKESELQKGDEEAYPLAVKAEASVSDTVESADGNLKRRDVNSQITLARFEMKEGEYKVKVMKQILWINGKRYELQEIYGIGNSVKSYLDDNNTGKECVVCLSEPRDTTTLPCRHMCMCGECATALRFHSNKCPMCRQPIQRLLELKLKDER